LSGLRQDRPSLPARQALDLILIFYNYPFALAESDKSFYFWMFLVPNDDYFFPILGQKLD
jgi:hypothetical protein